MTSVRSLSLSSSAAAVLIDKGSRAELGGWPHASPSYSGGGSINVVFGVPGDKPVPADYDGDSKEDFAVYHPSTGTWQIYQSTTGTTVSTAFGISTDIPVPGDYDGDGRDDIAVYRNGTWYANRSFSGFMAVPFGLSSDIAVPKAYIP